MSLKCQTVINWIEQLAPKVHAEKWDNIGLQIGSPNSDVKKILVSLDLDKEVVHEAIELGVDLIIVHHTPMFKPVQNIRFDLPQGYIISQLIKHNINLYTAHTNLDSTIGGVNDVLAEMLSLTNVEVLAPSWQEVLCKIVVFVPEGYEDQVRSAMVKQGAGWIGAYSDCSFQTKGTGTFRPLEGTNPFLGQQGKLEMAEEIRLETIVPEKMLKKVVNAMVKAHPYEEVAYDIYKLENIGKTTGLGRIGLLPQPMTLNQFIFLVKQSLVVRNLRFVGALDKPVKKVALCGGSGATLINKASFKGADVLITGDVKYHEAQEALALNLAVVDAGHFNTEYPIVSVVGNYLKNKIAENKMDAEVFISNVNTDPFNYA